MTAFDPGFPPLGGDVEALTAAWREACEEMRHAYLRWRVRGAAGAGDEFAAYVAAADREAVAADVLARHAVGDLAPR